MYFTNCKTSNNAETQFINWHIHGSLSFILSLAPATIIHWYNVSRSKYFVPFQIWGGLPFVIQNKYKHPNNPTPPFPNHPQLPIPCLPPGPEPSPSLFRVCRPGCALHLRLEGWAAGRLQLDSAETPRSSTRYEWREVWHLLSPNHDTRWNIRAHPAPSLLSSWFTSRCPLV